jgi:hypothetical protein
MRRWAISVCFALSIGGRAIADEVKTSTAGMTPEDIELARYLEVLEDLDLFEKWELIELLPVLEEEPER